MKHHGPVWVRRIWDSEHKGTLRRYKTTNGKLVPRVIARGQLSKHARRNRARIARRIT